MFTAPNIADDVAFAYEPGGLQHSSSHSALILSRSIFVLHCSSSASGSGTVASSFSRISDNASCKRA